MTLPPLAPFPSTPVMDQGDLVDLLRATLAARRRGEEQLAVLVVRLRHLGLPAERRAEAREAADREMGRRLAAVVRAQDRWLRAGAGHFVLLLDGVAGAAHATLAAHRIRAVCEVPVRFGSRDFSAVARVGIALAPEHSDDADELLYFAAEAADQAQHASDGWTVFDQGGVRRFRLARDLGPALRAAIEQNALAMHFQPQVSLADERLIGFEALLRWTCQGEPVSPPDVLAVAEQAGLSHRLTRWIINASLRQLASLRAAGLETRMSINLQPSDFADRELADFVELSLDTWRVPAACVTMEITEGSVLDELAPTVATLQRLKSRGLKVSLDDFGTGFSSLTHVRRLPLDELKIDQSFVRTMLTVPGDEQIVRTVIDLAHNFGLAAVAEGVEDATVAARLRELGCDAIQGYHIAPAMDEAAVLRWCGLRAY